MVLWLTTAGGVLADSVWPPMPDSIANAVAVGAATTTLAALLLRLAYRMFRAQTVTTELVRERMREREEETTVAHVRPVYRAVAAVPASTEPPEGMTWAQVYKLGFQAGERGAEN